MLTEVNNASRGNSSFSGNEASTFITYDVQYDGEDFDITPIKAQRPSEDVLFLIGKDIEYLRDLNIQYFNFTIFENDLDKLNDSEFSYFWEKFFENWINDINENYLDINLESFEFQLGTLSEKKFLIKKISHFIMQNLPYLVLKNIFKDLGINEEHEAKSYLQNLKNDQDFNLSRIKEFRQLIIKNLEKPNEKLVNLIQSLNSFTKISKKGELEHTFELLKKQQSQQEVYVELFKIIIRNTEIDKLIDLCIKYLEEDGLNII
jgi:hypothetical protein